MRYLWFEAENFKGIPRARLELSLGGSSRVFSLVGLNESGKTTVLEAIDYFQAFDPEGAEISPKQLGDWAAPSPHELIPIAERTNFNGAVTLRCGVEIDEEDIDALRNYLKSTKGYRLERMSTTLEVTDSSFYADSRFRRRTTAWSGLELTGKARGTKDTRTVDSLSNTHVRAATSFLGTRLPTVWFFPNFLFEFPERIFLELEDNESESNLFYRTLLQDILDALDQNLEIKRHIIDRARSNRESEHDNLRAVLLTAGRHVTTTVVSAWNRIFADRELDEKSVRLEYVWDEDDGLYVSFRLEDDGGEFSITERSLGFQWFFVYLLLTTYRGRRKGPNEDVLFLFDEPASNLHSTAQSALLSSLSELSNDATIIYTTHSHHLINPEWLGSTFVVTNEGVDPRIISADNTARRTSIAVTPYRRFAAEHPNQSHYFQPILDVLEYAPSQLELVPSVVMTEGKNDYYILEYFQKVVLPRKEDEVLNLLPGGGAGTLDRPIQLYLAWGRPFIALLDSDKGGRREAERYLEKFGLILEQRLIDLKAAAGDKSVSGMESLLPQKDRLAIQKVAEPTARRYTKKGFARGIQEALVTRRRVTVTATSKRRVDKLLGTLRGALDSVSKSTPQ
jgi:predicted ATPase